MTRLVLMLLLASRAALAASATQVVVPTYAGTVAGGAQMSTIVDQLRCATVLMPFSITATKLIFGVITGAGTCAVGLYPDSNTGSILLSSNGVSCTSAGPKVGTSSAATVTAGTSYRLCTCSSSGTTTITAIEDATSSFTAMMNTTAPRYGIAASSCSAGALPPTTGALTPDTSVKAPIVVIE